MREPGFVIRRADRNDLAALGRLGAVLMRTHYDFDPRRFMAPGASPEQGYGQFLRTQLGSDDAVVFVAEGSDGVVGYVYAGLEPRSWKELRDAAGFIHDLAVDDRARGAGIGRRLLNAAIEWLTDQGVPRVMLWTAPQNEHAQRLFAALGFRPTMVEMTREV